MASIIRVPIDIRSPEQTGIAGNSFWTVQSGAASQFGYWAYLGNVTGGITYGFVQVPRNVDLNSIGRIVLAMASSATANAVSVWRVGTREIQTGNTFDISTWTNENSQSWTAPTTAWARQDLSFTMTSATTADALLAIKIERPITASGSSTDTTTSTVGVFDAFLEITATA